MSSSSDTVVAYHDAYLTAADIRLLQPGQWLNDAVIHAVLEYYAHGHPQLAAAASAGRLAFIAPATVHLARAVGAEELPLLLGALGLAQAATVFLPLNDSDPEENASANRGSHWTLLAYDRAADRWTHYDSWGSSAEVPAHARQLARALRDVVGAGRADGAITAGLCPPQGNSSDCGVHVAVNIERLALASLDGTEPRLLRADEAAEARRQLKVSQEVERHGRLVT